MTLSRFSFILFLKKIISSIQNFFVRYGWLIVIYTIVQFLPEFRYKPYEVSKWLWSSVPLYFVNACCICLIGELIKKAGGRLWGKTFCKWWHALCHICIYSFSFIEFYLVNAFHLRINDLSIMLLLQTNKSEASEFLQTYLFGKAFFISLAVLAVIGVLEWLLLKYRYRLNIFRNYVVTAILAIFFCLGLHSSFLATKMIFADNSIKALSIVRNNRWDLSENFYVRVYYSLWATRDNIESGKEIVHHINDTRVLSKTQYSGNIVLVIGESHSKIHTSLYGYHKPTYPYLENMRDSLSIFTDVISPNNATHIVFREILSVSSMDDGSNWYDATLFPAVFNSAGWNVALCSNQITDKRSMDVFDSAIEFVLNKDEVSNACFTTRNSSTFKYDSQMLDSLLANKAQNIDLAKPSLYIVHLMGQHFKCGERFPPEHAFFKASDYADREELSGRQKQDVADCDNASRENDLQLYRIFQAFAGEDAIVIYMSDHGDEAHDYCDHIGRNYDLAGYAPMSYHCQIDVPFIVYMTETYKRNHPEKAEQVRASVNRPFMIDDICHLLFYLGDVDTKWFDPRRCLIHPEFNTKRKRILKTGEDYDEAVKK